MILALALAGIGAQAAALPSTTDALPALEPAITAAELSHHVRFLAADELRGRAVGTPDCARAARYLARVLEAEGIAPAGDDGTFLQAVPLERVEHASPPRLVLVDAEGAETVASYGADFRLWGGSFPRSTGALRLVPEPPLEGGGPFAVTLGRAAQSPGTGLAVLTVPPPKRPVGPPPAILARVTEEHGAPIVLVFGDLAQRLDGGAFATAQLVVDLRRELAGDHNVVGRIDGGGAPEAPELARETIVVSAHYDHIGTRADSPGHGAEPAGGGDDEVYNGADDDASGVAAVLELAGALAAGERPARTVVFLLATGEERGLLGTEHYLEHPLVPLEDTVLNLNFEMVGRPDPLAGGPGRAWLTGFELTNLGPAFEAAGLAIVADPHPEEHFFERSDNIAFVQRGIVGQSLSSYGMHPDYHALSDEADTLDYAHLESVTRSSLEALRMIASGDLDPVWVAGAPPR